MNRSGGGRVDAFLLGRVPILVRDSRLADVGPDHEDVLAAEHHEWPAAELLGGLVVQLRLLDLCRYGERDEADQQPDAGADGDPLENAAPGRPLAGGPRLPVAPARQPIAQRGTVAGALETPPRLVDR